MAAWRRTRDATILWLKRRGVLAIIAMPVVFIHYALDPLAAVRELSNAREVMEQSANRLAHGSTHTRLISMCDIHQDSQNFNSCRFNDAAGRPETEQQDGLARSAMRTLCSLQK